MACDDCKNYESIYKPMADMGGYYICLHCGKVVKKMEGTQ